MPKDTNPAEKLKVGERTVGVLKNNIFTKTVWLSKHLFGGLDAWGIDAGIFETKLLPTNAKIRIKEMEERMVYETDAQKFKHFGVCLHFKLDPSGARVGVVEGTPDGTVFLPEASGKLTDWRAQILLPRHRFSEKGLTLGRMVGEISPRTLRSSQQARVRRMRNEARMMIREADLASQRAVRIQRAEQWVLYAFGNAERFVEAFMRDDGSTRHDFRQITGVTEGELFPDLPGLGVHFQHLPDRLRVHYPNARGEQTITESRGWPNFHLSDYDLVSPFTPSDFGLVPPFTP